MVLVQQAQLERRVRLRVRRLQHRVPHRRQVFVRLRQQEPPLLLHVRRQPTESKVASVVRKLKEAAP